ncbi:hypothetical protein PHOSAC3_150243 [Mesotoga infera]|nr:hypothetical protein PHOSAC3_150243 [Mesotoga infera]
MPEIDYIASLLQDIQGGFISKRIVAGTNERSVSETSSEERTATP